MRPEHCRDSSPSTICEAEPWVERYLSDVEFMVVANTQYFIQDLYSISMESPIIKQSEV